LTQGTVKLDRGVIKLAGQDSKKLLQGIITNDVNKLGLGAESAIYTCLLTPQGKYLFDFFVVATRIKDADVILLDCASSQTADLIKRLAMYKLRADVSIQDISAEYHVYARLGSEKFAGALVEYPDARHPELGFRVITERLVSENDLTDYSEYEALRVRLCIPEVGAELISGEVFPLHCNMEELNAIDYNKGCYVGQEVTARTKHRGVVRKKLFSVYFESEMPESGAVLTLGGKEAGQLLSTAGNYGIAKLAVEIAGNLDSPIRFG
jgi:folate-binding protein YgfZ